MKVTDHNCNLICYFATGNEKGMPEIIQALFLAAEN